MAGRPTLSVVIVAGDPPVHLVGTIRGDAWSFRTTPGGRWMVDLNDTMTLASGQGRPTLPLAIMLATDALMAYYGGALWT